MLSSSELFWTNKRVLITGHTGFKGSWLSLLLNRLGAIVSGYSLPPSNPSLYQSCKISSLLHYNCFSDIGDIHLLRDFVSKVQPDIVFHLAAQPLVFESYRHPLDTWSTNVIGSLNLLDSLQSISHNCTLVVVTTDKVYLNNEASDGYIESDSLGGSDPYSSVKLLLNLPLPLGVLAFVVRLLPKSLFVYTARAGNVIGGGDWSADRLLPDLMLSLFRSESFYSQSCRNSSLAACA